MVDDIIDLFYDLLIDCNIQILFCLVLNKISSVSLHQLPSNKSKKNRIRKDHFKRTSKHQLSMIW